MKALVQPGDSRSGLRQMTGTGNQGDEKPWWRCLLHLHSFPGASSVVSAPVHAIQKEARAGYIHLQ